MIKEFVIKKAAREITVANPLIKNLPAIAGRLLKYSVEIKLQNFHHIRRFGWRLDY